MARTATETTTSVRIPVLVEQVSTGFGPAWQGRVVLDHVDGVPQPLDQVCTRDHPTKREALEAVREAVADAVRFAHDTRLLVFHDDGRVSVVERSPHDPRQVVVASYQYGRQTGSCLGGWASVREAAEATCEDTWYGPGTIVR